MTERSAFLAAIIAEPDCDAHRLVYADWLEEHGGEPNRARFIRVQCEQARIPEPEYKTIGGIVFPGDEVFRYSAGTCVECWKLGAKCRYHALEAAAEMLLRIGDWYPVQPAGWANWTWESGFIQSLDCTAADWLAHADAIHWHPSQDRPCPETAHPVRKVVLTTHVEIVMTGDGEQVRVSDHYPAVVFVADLPRLTRRYFRRSDMPEQFARFDAMIVRRETSPLLSIFWPGVEFELPPPDNLIPTAAAEVLGTQVVHGD